MLQELLAVFAWDSKILKAHFRDAPSKRVDLPKAEILVTLYFGPVGLLVYVLADKEPVPGTHEELMKPLWKQ